ncbi:MAG: T9SS type A sorting domain-containing protein [Flavobacteriaceae bacterium]|nr:T9SS type A sorting domain-containing protein [Flavobacteriaceae bacterium]
MKKIIFLLFLFSGLFQVSAQCSFDPIIEGDIFFCPFQEEGELFSTIDNADAYQWFSRPFSGGSEMPISGATNNSLAVFNADILTYYSVDVTVDGCTERSPEVLLDQWVFLLPSVIATGDFIFDAGTYLICEGDSMFLALNNPYDTNITWFRDGSPIPDETDQTLEITTPGSYTVSGAPSVCPDYIQPLGLSLDVAFNTDPEVCDILNLDDFTHGTLVHIYPNPTQDMVNLVAKDPLDSIVVFSIMGQKLYQVDQPGIETTINFTAYTTGTYFIKMQLGNSIITRKIVKE